VTIALARVTDVLTLLSLDPVKPDAFLGASPQLGWERIFGGQVVAQALRAAALTVDAPHGPHSLHAYFVRPGDERQPVLYEVDRVRDGRSFTTRQVVAYQAGGAILNLIASFHHVEAGEDVQLVRPPAVPPPDDCAPEDSDLFIEQRLVERVRHPEPRSVSWLRIAGSLGDDPVVHACALAYLSDENPMGAAFLPHSSWPDWDRVMTASLDHALWFHRPVRADEWLLVVLEGSSVAGARGLATGRMFTADGVHVASVGQEGLVRDLRG
jgi:acyl-CoA thioesterase-2